eukprot:1138134-Pelagomonas_calceolata.AAC.10
MAAAAATIAAAAAEVLRWCPEPLMLSRLLHKRPARGQCMKAAAAQRQPGGAVSIVGLRISDSQPPSCMRGFHAYTAAYLALAPEGVQLTKLEACTALEQAVQLLEDWRLVNSTGAGQKHQLDLGGLSWANGEVCKRLIFWKYLNSCTCYCSHAAQTKCGIEPERRETGTEDIAMCCLSHIHCDTSQSTQTGKDIVHPRV